MIYSILYTLFLFPYLLLQKLIHKKNPKAFLYKLGIKFPLMQVPKDKKIYWIHSVSLGETKAAITLIHKLRKDDPHCWIVQSTVTDTGYEQAKKNQVDIVIYMPFDFPWLMKRYMKMIRPDEIYIIENDLWPNFLKQGKKYHAKIILISAHLSDRSFARLKKVTMIACWLYKPIDQIITQSKESFDRFAYFVSQEKLKMGENLKRDVPIEKLNAQELLEWKNTLRTRPKTIAITCTHETEEKILLETILSEIQSDPDIKILLAPRHPARFAKVFTYIQTLPVTIGKLSNTQEDVQILLIDQMGILPIVYQCSDLAILGGSFIRGVGGHNLYEPFVYKIPVLFGPHMEKQKENVLLLKNEKNITQVSLQTLAVTIKEILQSKQAFVSCR